MPLHAGKSKKVMSSNIKEMVAVAAAYRKAGKAKKRGK